MGTLLLWCRRRCVVKYVHQYVCCRYGWREGKREGVSRCLGRGGGGGVGVGEDEDGNIYIDIDEKYM